MHLICPLVDGSCWITSNRLIVLKHESGQLYNKDPEFYYLNNVKKAKIKDEGIVVNFRARITKEKVELKPIMKSTKLLKKIKKQLESKKSKKLYIPLLKT